VNANGGTGNAVSKRNMLSQKHHLNHTLLTDWLLVLGQNPERTSN
jgi:hypothetical protein